jgi:hypothetical protein
MRRVKLTSAVKTDSPYVCGDANDILLLDDYAAFFVVRQGLGEYYGPAPAPGPSRAELEAEEAQIAAGTLQAIPISKSQEAIELPEKRTVVDPADLVSPEDRAEAEAEAAAESVPKRPYGNAPKSAWIRYACEVDPDMTPERAEGMTKADLMSRYGERL